MREYKKGINFRENEEVLLKVYCNCCGMNIQLINNRICNGVFGVNYSWGYFSEKDGEKHSFDMCEKCYDKMISKFKIPVTIENNSEMMY